MKKLVLQILLLALSMLSLKVWAGIDVFEFSSEENRAQYYALTKELRCPKCQNQDIADSNAPIAQDMRNQVHRLVEEGKSTESVVQFMVERFGDFVTYKPKIIPATYLLWFGPFVLAGIGLLVVLVLANKKRQSAKPDLVALDETARKRLDKILKDAENNQPGDADKGNS